MLTASHRILASLTVLVALVVGASTSQAARHQEPYSNFAPVLASASTRHAISAHSLSGLSTVVVNQAWAGFPSGTDVTVGGNHYKIGTDAFATIQAGVLAVAPGGTVNVLPGSYMETAPNSYIFNGAGPYQFGVFVGVGSPGITIQGVTTTGAPITSAAAVATTIDYAATNSFGSSGWFIEADHVTVRGLGIGSQTIGWCNKTIEAIGDDFTLRDCSINDQNYGSLYINDWRATMTTSVVQSYHVLNNVFIDGNSVDVASGAGINGSVANRVISGNTFAMSDNYNSVSFTGTTPSVGWYLYPVGGATIAGNSFTNTNPAGTIIKARGTYDNNQFDWASYWNGNTFNQATCEGIAPPANLRPYSYTSSGTSFTNARRIEATVQGEVDNAVAGDIVLLHAGSYTEQVVVNGKSVTLQGAGKASTTIVSPVTLTQYYATSANNYPIVLCENAADIEINSLTIDGAGRGNGNYRFQGVGFWNAGGKILGCDIVHVRETPFNGDQHGVSVYAYNNTNGPYSIEVGNCSLTDFQKNAFALNGTGLTANVHDCTIVGQGNTPLNAQNGVQIAYGASGTVTNVQASALFYTPNTDAACGVLAYLGGTVNVTNLTATACQTGVYYEDVNGAVNGLSVSGNTSGVPSTGVEFLNDNSTLMAATSSGAGGHVPLPASPITDDLVGNRAARPNATTSTAMTVSVGPGCFVGDGMAGSYGVQFYSYGAPLACSVTGAELTNWGAAIVAGGSGIAATAQHNSIVGSVAYGFLSDPGNTNNATLNWWGAASGPAGTNATSGPVTYSPWLLSGTDLNPGCGFTALADNAVTPGPAPTCISMFHPCVTIPVSIARTTSDHVRGFSITFHVSSNLQLCSGTSSVTEGSYLNSVSPTTHFEVVDNHSGSYTVDCAILGSTPGATAVSGQLFSLAVAKVTNGTGTVTIDNVTMRDVDNNPVAASIGSPLSITIDDAAPAAIANLASTQVKTGNPTSNRTRVQLAFTAPIDAASIEVWRAPFGSYPEYNRMGGAVPALPVGYPPSGWTQTSVTATGQMDTPPARDFWYYVAYSYDACGNRSAVSNLTAGSLDYHLGDVVDPGNPSAQGDDAVNGSDISRLGFHYGISLATPDPYDYLDVGPTTNYSVNARPSPDKKVGFEDMILFAINYGQVSAPQDGPRPQPSAQDRVALDVPQLPAVGATFAVGVQLDAAGDVQGASAKLAWNGAVVEPVGVESGALLATQPAPSVVLSPEAGTVDFALLGDGAALAGSGEAARVIFRVKASGDAAISLASLTARDTQNQPVTFTSQPSTSPATPAKTELGPAYPNPFVHEAALRLSLAREGAVRVTLYDLAGRRVRTLMDSVQPAGVRVVRWDGRNDSGLRMAPGVYVMRLEAAGMTQSRRLQFVP